MRTMNQHMIAVSVAGGLLVAGCGNTPDEQKAETRSAIENVQDRMNESAATATSRAPVPAFAYWSFRQATALVETNKSGH